MRFSLAEMQLSSEIEADTVHRHLNALVPRRQGRGTWNFPEILGRLEREAIAAGKNRVGCAWSSMQRAGEPDEPVEIPGRKERKTFRSWLDVKRAPACAGS